jgi:hypothetical protein
MRRWDANIGLAPHEVVAENPMCDFLDHCPVIVNFGAMIAWVRGVSSRTARRPGFDGVLPLLA